MSEASASASTPAAAAEPRRARTESASAAAAPASSIVPPSHHSHLATPQARGPPSAHTHTPGSTRASRSGSTTSAGGTGIGTPNAGGSVPMLSHSLSHTRMRPPAAQLRLGDRAESTDGRRRGVVKYLGPLEAKAGEWVGLELDEGQQGKHDGLVDGKRYFTCAPMRGLFMPRNRMALVEPAGGSSSTGAATTTPAAATAAATTRGTSTTQPHTPLGRSGSIANAAGSSSGSSSRTRTGASSSASNSRQPLQMGLTRDELQARLREAEQELVNTIHAHRREMTALRADHNAMHLQLEQTKALLAAAQSSQSRATGSERASPAPSTFTQTLDAAQLRVVIETLTANVAALQADLQVARSEQTHLIEQTAAAQRQLQAALAERATERQTSAAASSAELKQMSNLLSSTVAALQNELQAARQAQAAADAQVAGLKRQLQELGAGGESTAATDSANKANGAAGTVRRRSGSVDPVLVAISGLKLELSKLREQQQQQHAEAEAAARRRPTSVPSAASTSSSRSRTGLSTAAADAKEQQEAIVTAVAAAINEVKLEIGLLRAQQEEKLAAMVAAAAAAGGDNAAVAAASTTDAAAAPSSADASVLQSLHQQLDKLLEAQAALASGELVAELHQEIVDLRTSMPNAAATQPVDGAADASMSSSAAVLQALQALQEQVTALTEAHAALASGEAVAELHQEVVDLRTNLPVAAAGESAGAAVTAPAGDTAATTDALQALQEQVAKLLEAQTVLASGESVAELHQEIVDLRTSLPPAATGAAAMPDAASTAGGDNGATAAALHSLQEQVEKLMEAQAALASGEAVAELHQEIVDFRTSLPAPAAAAESAAPASAEAVTAALQQLQQQVASLTETQAALASGESVAELHQEIVDLRTSLPAESATAASSGSDATSAALQALQDQISKLIATHEADTAVAPTDTTDSSSQTATEIAALRQVVTAVQQSLEQVLANHRLQQEQQAQGNENAAPQETNATAAAATTASLEEIQNNLQKLLQLAQHEPPSNNNEISGAGTAASLTAALQRIETQLQQVAEQLVLVAEANKQHEEQERQQAEPTTSTTAADPDTEPAWATGLVTQVFTTTTQLTAVSQTLDGMRQQLADLVTASAREPLTSEAVGEVVRDQLRQLEEVCAQIAVDQAQLLQDSVSGAGSVSAALSAGLAELQAAVKEIVVPPAHEDGTAAANVQPEAVAELLRGPVAEAAALAAREAVSSLTLPALPEVQPTAIAELLQQPLADATAQAVREAATAGGAATETLEAVRQVLSEVTVVREQETAAATELAQLRQDLAQAGQQGSSVAAIEALRQQLEDSEAQVRDVLAEVRQRPASTESDAMTEALRAVEQRLADVEKLTAAAASAPAVNGTDKHMPGTDGEPQQQQQQQQQLKVVTVRPMLLEAQSVLQKLLAQHLAQLQALREARAGKPEEQDAAVAAALEEPLDSSMTQQLALLAERLTHCEDALDIWCARLVGEAVPVPDDAPTLDGEDFF